MIQSVLLKNDVYWLGVLDPNLDVLISSWKQNTGQLITLI